MTKRRLDLALVERGLVATRARARDAMLRGHVTVDGKPATRPAQIGRRRAPQSRVDDPASGYVSRGALKLIAALDRFGYSPAGRVALDVGASTGGFTQVLLERGATKGLRRRRRPRPARSRACRRSARDLARRRQCPRPDAGRSRRAGRRHRRRCQLHLAPPRPSAGAGARGAGGAGACFLVKPQFEVGREKIGKGGIVRDPALAERTVAGIAAWLEHDAGWRVDGVILSPIEGGDGNREFLLGARRG